MGSVSLTLPADVNTKPNGKQNGMPANLQMNSSSKGIEQRDGRPANFIHFLFLSLEATLGTTLGPLFAFSSTIWVRFYGGYHFETTLDDLLAPFGDVWTHFARHFHTLGLTWPTV